MGGARGGWSEVGSASPVIDALDIFTNWLPVAAKSLLASFNVDEMREAKQLDCVLHAADAGGGEIVGGVVAPARRSHTECT